MVSRRNLGCHGRLTCAKGVTTQNGVTVVTANQIAERPHVEEEQLTHSGDEIEIRALCCKSAAAIFDILIIFHFIFFHFHFINI